MKIKITEKVRSYNCNDVVNIMHVGTYLTEFVVSTHFSNITLIISYN